MPSAFPTTHDGGFPEDGFADLAAIEPGHFWFEARNRLIVWALTRFGGTPTTLLEVGCGTGFVLQALHEAFPRLQLTGTDALPGGLVFAQQRVPGGTFRQEDARHLAAVDSFDVVCAFDVLEHIPDDQTALDVLYRAARPGGLLMLTVPQHPWLWSRMDEIGHHVRRYRRQELVDRVVRAGFVPLKVTSFMSVVMPLLMISRLVESSTDDEALHREVKPAPIVNHTLRAALALERATIRAGVNWPFGGSLLLVARRPLAAR